MTNLRLRNRESGAASVEYGLIVFAIAALIVASVFALGAVNQESLVKSCESLRGPDSAKASATCQ